MTLAQSMTDAAAAIGALGTIATVLAHLPFMPAQYAEFFARFGLATQKFTVNQRPL